MSADRLCVVCTGSSAALQLPTHLATWRREVPAPMSVLLTHSSLTFVQPTAVSLVAQEVHAPSLPGAPVLNPVAFAEQAAVFVVAPATANFVVSASLGLASSPALTAMLATTAPRIVFPHMNPRMWAARTTQRAVSALRDDGVVVVTPEETEVLVLSTGSMERARAMPGPERTAEILAGFWQRAAA